VLAVRFVAHLIVNAIALWLAAEVISGVHFDGSLIALLGIALIFGIVNTLIKPLVKLFTLPLTVVTLGLFALVINAAMLLLTSALASSYSIDGLIPALLASILISVVSTVLNWFIKD
jgi:putative membrane protein